MVRRLGAARGDVFRGTHLLFAFVLVFLLIPAAGRDGRPPALAGRGWCIAAAAVAIGYLFVNYEYIVNRIIYMDDLTVLGQGRWRCSVLLVLEATRRFIGWALPITALVFLAYAVFCSGIKMQCCWSRCT